ncbi:NADP-dependent oxidoreductase domain-containing protein [Bipolaris maydis]|nr:NADP-dependent oxidoreductase domain-containing protein [Bipolaris maydis]
MSQLVDDIRIRNYPLVSIREVGGEPRPHGNFPEASKLRLELRSNLSDLAYFKTLEERNYVSKILLENGVNNIDTGYVYPESEAGIGQLEKPKEFTIDTKLPDGNIPGSVTKDDPDDSVPIEQTLEGINEAYKKGAFRRFGLSNYTAKQVQEVYDIAKAKGYSLPQVYPGHYNPIYRYGETEFLPTLRKLAITGGFLTKSIADIDAGVGRFNENVMSELFSKLYDHKHLRESLSTWNEIAKKEGVSNAELAYRWVAYHSALHGDEDSIFFGVSKLSQIEQTIQGIKKGEVKR